MDYSHQDQYLNLFFFRFIEFHIKQLYLKANHFLLFDMT